MAFLCRELHHESLNEAVIAATEAQSLPIAHGARQENAQPWRVIVPCSAGHDNVFEGQGAITPQSVGAGMPDLFGHAPNVADQLLQKSVAALSPVESVIRLDSTAKYLIGLVSTIATFTTAFGASPANGPVPTLVAFIPTFFAAISVLFGLAAVIPDVREVAVSNQLAVLSHYRVVVQQRGRHVKMSGVFLAIAILAAPLAFISK
jgi:hypothetical protein